MSLNSFLVALVSVLFLAGSPQASAKPAKEPAESPTPTTKVPAPKASSPLVKKIVTDEAIPPIKKRAASDGAAPPVKKVATAGTTPPVKVKPTPWGSTPPVKRVVAGGVTPPVKTKPGAPAAMEEFASVLDRCDQNRDQAVTLAEFQKNQPAGKDSAAVEKWFHTRDANRDGKLSKEDFRPLTSKKA